MLGSITIGKYSKIGAGSVVLKDVPDYSTVVGIPGHVVVQNGKRVSKNLDHNKLPDPIDDYIAELQEDVRKLKEELSALKGEMQDDD